MKNLARILNTKRRSTLHNRIYNGIICAVIYKKNRESRRASLWFYKQYSKRLDDNFFNSLDWGQLCMSHTHTHRKTHWQLAHAPVPNPPPLFTLPLPLHCFSFVSGIQNRPKNKYLSICLRGEHMKGLSGRTGRQREGQGVQVNEQVGQGEAVSQLDNFNFNCGPQLTRNS